MRTKNFLFALVSVLLVIGLALPQALAQSASKGKPIVLKALSFHPSNNVKMKAYQEWLKKINERAKGELVINYLGGPEVIPYAEQPQAIRKGVVDLSICGASRFKGLVPEARMMALSLLTSAEEKKAGAEALMREYFSKGGFYFIGRGDPKLEPKQFALSLTKKIVAFDDLKGLRLGANGTYVDAMAKALGMSITILKASDAYSALDRGMIDAYAYALEDVRTYSLYEVTPYILEHSLYRSNTNITMNIRKWNSLPSHLQELIMDTYEEYVPIFIEINAKGKLDAKEFFKKSGIEFVTFSPADKERFIQTAYEAEAQKYLKEMPKTAPDYLKLVGAIN